MHWRLIMTEVWLYYYGNKIYICNQVQSYATPNKWKDDGK